MFGSDSSNTLKHHKKSDLVPTIFVITSIIPSFPALINKHDGVQLCHPLILPLGRLVDTTSCGRSSSPTD